MYYVIALVALLIIIFTPRVGLLAMYKAFRASQAREQVEDALKHLLDREQQGRHASPESLGGTLDLPRQKATRLIEDMETQGLLESRGAELHLTAEGERWALHVVRAHRLWERYLADEARMPLNQIHNEAHRREHSLTDAQLDELDAALGHPTHDPHGDPIPSRVGKINRVEGMPLTAWQADRPARIVHLEDEPAIAYQQILAAGLRPGAGHPHHRKKPEPLCIERRRERISARACGGVECACGGAARERNVETRGNSAGGTGAGSTRTDRRAR
ncbi:MAG: hypothetical protein HND47_09415 [Chloroflexi bacterium]|nr:hypothetical protein [Chloroflexota bacterium]